MAVYTAIFVCLQCYIVLVDGMCGLDSCIIYCLYVIIHFSVTVYHNMLGTWEIYDAYTTLYYSKKLISCGKK